MHLRMLSSGIFLFSLGCSETTSGPDPGDGPGPEPLWVRSISVHALAEPLRADAERVYLSSPFGVGALNRETGEAVWEEEPSTGLAGFSFVIVGDIVVVAREDALVGLEATTGDLLWVREATPVGSLTASESIGLFATDGERVVSYNPQTGASAWDAPVEQGGFIVLSATSGLVCAERLVSAPSDARVTCYDQSDGTIRWSRLVHSPPWIATGATHVVVAGLEVQEGSGLMGLDRESGEAVWKNPDLSGNLPAVSPEGDVLYTCSEGCMAVRVNDGGVRWQTSLEKDVGAPALGEGFVFVVGFLSEPNPLYILDATTGLLRSEILPDLFVDPSGFCGTPVTSEDLLFVFSCGGTLYAYQISSLL